MVQGFVVDKFVWDEAAGGRLGVVVLMADILGSILGTNTIYASHFSYINFVYGRLWNDK